MSKAEAADVVVDEIMAVWNPESIPTSHKPKCVERIKALLKEYENICRNRNRKGKRQLELETAFQGKLKTLFNIANADAIGQIKDPRR